MASIYLSFTRSDLPFANRLSDALMAAGQYVRSDTEGIESTEWHRADRQREDWQSAVERAIDEADVFVLILSPETLHSDPRVAELRYAMEAGKRIVPVVYQKMDPQDIPSGKKVDAVAELPWLSFREDFDHAVTQLLAVLTQDEAYWHQSSQLLVRARLWNAKGDDWRLLLRDTDLTDANHWLDASATKKPSPTELQRTFIITSRAAARAQTPRARLGLTLTTFTAALLSLLAIFFATLAAFEHQAASQGRPLVPFSPWFVMLFGLSLLLNAVLGGSSASRALRTVTKRLRPVETVPQDQVFISYSHNDSKFVDQLDTDLQEHGFKVWLDRRLEGGQVWDEKIRDELDRSPVVLLVQTPDALQSDPVRKEYMYALRHGKTIIPLRFHPSPPLPRELGRLQYMDFLADIDFETKYRFSLGQLADRLVKLGVPRQRNANEG